MKKGRGSDPAIPLLDAIVHGIQEIKGKDVVHLDLRSLQHSPADHFIICHGDSPNQVEAIARSVEKTVKERVHEKPWHSEGKDNAGWVLLDYVNVVVHIFHRDQRSYYALEQLWSDASTTTYENVA